MKEKSGLEGYIARVRPLLPRLFNLAHAVTGNAECAERIVLRALTEVCREGGGGRGGLGELLKRTTLRLALKEGSGAELTWDMLSEEGDPESQLKEIRSLLAREDIIFRRAVTLIFGAGLSVSRAAKLAGTDAGELKERLRSFEKRAARRMPRPEAAIARAVRASMNEQDRNMNAPSDLLRAFRADAAGIRKTSQPAGNALRIAVYVLLTLLCAAAFWFAAVLLAPAIME